MIEDHGIGYLEGCATKYVTRWRKKGIPEQDLGKAEHYIEKLIEKVEQVGRGPRGEVPSEVMAEFEHANGLTVTEGEIVYLLTGRWTVASLHRALELTRQLHQDWLAEQQMGSCDCEEVDPVTELTGKIFDVSGDYDLQTGLTVFANVVGQVIVATSEGIPARVEAQANDFHKGVLYAARGRMLYDAEAKGRG